MAKGEWRRAKGRKGEWRKGERREAGGESGEDRSRRFHGSVLDLGAGLWRRCRPRCFGSRPAGSPRDLRFL
ncbi:MAG: hypothetical protein D6795_07190 [Deltaproteobacteria bacterium]|nr:MAG: hypothetical protein D6795_07190 [Deltaproteobacteria bacterium]